jgi:hypothetical protein
MPKPIVRRRCMSFRSFLVSLIALVALAGPVGANLVLNPGFETGDFTGWSVTGDGILIDNVFPNTGLYDAAFSALTTDSDPGVLSQVLTTSPGLSYTISFALLDEAGFSGDSFIVQFGGYTTTVTGDMAAPPGDLPSLYTAFSFTAPSATLLAQAQPCRLRACKIPQPTRRGTSTTSSSPDPLPPCPNRRPGPCC